MKARILFDGRVLRHRQCSGVEVYAGSLAKELASEVTVLKPSAAGRYGQQVWEHTRLPLAAAGADLLFCPANIAPAWLPGSTQLLLTLHDTAYLDFPRQYSTMFRRYYSMLVPRNLHRAQAVVTVSEFARGRILEHYPWVEPKLSVIPHGIGPEFHPEGRTERIDVLYVGSLNPVKNFSRVLEVFLSGELESGTLEMVLAVSESFRLSPEDRRLLKKAEQAPNIRLRTDISFDAMPAVYRSAKLLLFPSLHESFGFPVLEAMACGTPVVTSRRGALSDLCGGAARYVDPENIPEMARTVRRLLDDGAERMKMRDAGLARAKRYRWSTAAGAYRSLFARLLEKSRK